MQLSGGLHAHIELARGPTPDEWCVAMQQSTSVAQGMQCLLDEHPKEYFERGKHIKGMLELKHAPAPLPPKYSMAQFNADADAVKADLRAITASSKSIIFSGPTGCGKTSLAITLIAALGAGRAVKINTRDGFKAADGETGGIVVDDMEMVTWSPEELLNILNPEFDCTINCRYGDAHLRAGLPRIFTTNTTMIGRDTFLPQGRNAHQEAALNRRMHIIRIAGQLFSEMAD